MDRFFFVPPEFFLSDGYVEFPPDEANHAFKVLRLRTSAVVSVVDGQGVCVKVQIEQCDRQGVRGRIIAAQENPYEPTRKLTIGLALLKQRSRYKMFLEKSVELGVTTILPLITERTESRTWRKDRATQVMIAALKQCRRSKLPELQSPKPLDSVLGPDLLLADPNATTPLLTIVDRSRDPVTILIGPEGGFSENERILAQARGATLVRLGPRHLRAETAAICSAAAVMLAG
ncbi:MAG: RsmE family RNA methyltransferase [Bacteroidota bacterium]|nr:RsmE family RNA methyltransferase [Bacteroidota bacterium]